MECTLEFLHTNEWEEVEQESVNPHKGVRDVLGSMMATLGLFRILINFSIPKFAELKQLSLSDNRSPCKIYGYCLCSLRPSI